MVFAISNVAADPQHSVDHVLAVNPVVELRHPVIARINVGEGTQVAG